MPRKKAPKQATVHKNRVPGQDYLDEEPTRPPPPRNAPNTSQPTSQISNAPIGGAGGSISIPLIGRNSTNNVGPSTGNSTTSSGSTVPIITTRSSSESTLAPVEPSLAISSNTSVTPQQSTTTIQAKEDGKVERKERPKSRRDVLQEFIESKADYTELQLPRKPEDGPPAPRRRQATVLANFLQVGLKNVPLYKYQLKLGKFNGYFPTKPELKKKLIGNLVEHLIRKFDLTLYWASDFDSVLITSSEIPPNKDGTNTHSHIFEGNNVLDSEVLFNREISLRPFYHHFQGINNSIGHAAIKEVAEIVRVLNIVSLKNISQSDTVGTVGKKFYPTFRAPQILRTKGLNGERFWLHENLLEAQLGFFTSIRPGCKMSLLNVNTTTSAFFAQAKVSNWIKTLKGDKGNSGLKVKDLVGSRVKIDGDEKAVRTIYKILQDPDQDAIGKIYQNISDKNVLRVEDNLEERPYGDAPYVNLGNEKYPDWYSASFLTIQPFQPLRKTTTSEVMVNGAERTPQHNKMRIRKLALRELGISVNSAPNFDWTGALHESWMQNTELCNLGIEKIQPNFVECSAFFLKPPLISYKNGTKSLMGNAESPSWNLANQKFSVPGKFGTTLHFLNLRIDEGGNAAAKWLPDCGEFLCGELRKYGLTVSGINFADVRVNGMHSSTSLKERTAFSDQLDKGAKLLKEQNGDQEPPLIIVLLSTRKDVHTYPLIKFWADCKRKVPSIVMIAEKIFNAVHKKDYDKKNSKPDLKTLGNMCLKINFKTGGTNHILNDKFPPKFSNTMIMGADVTHPKGEGTCPSMAGVVSTTGPGVENASTYLASARLQPARMEYIEDLKSMVRERVERWHSTTGKLPSSIIFYRDGVSESQYEMVKTLEYNQIRNGFREFADAIGEKGKEVKVTLVVVVKRHHTRFFPKPIKGKKEPEELRDGFSNSRKSSDDKNCEYGMVVDSVVVDPNYFNFYLQSHRSDLGTAKSSHYFVIQNGMDLTCHELQTFTNQLCFTSCRALTPLSVCAPALYADKLCDRLRCYLKPALDEIIVVELGEGQEPKDVVGVYRNNPRIWPLADRRQNPWGKALDHIMFYM